MTSAPQEPVNAAEEDPTVEPGRASDAHGVPTSQGPSVAEDGGEEPGADQHEVEVGLGPSD